MAPLEIRLLAARESPEIYAELARLHAEEISGGFLTSLGTPLLARLYRAIGRSPDAFILTASLEKHVVGFLCASTDTRRVYRYVLSRSWIHLIPALARRIFSWQTVRRCWETLRYPTRSPVPDLPGAEILNFCVTQKLQRAGIGQALFAAMKDEYRRRDIRRIRIVTGANQLSAIRFYEKLGAEPVGTIEVHARTESRLFRYSI
jgi:ribosomal protein S18 acetylase RimI-like enzyme